jgi:hypothetical protein
MNFSVVFKVFEVLKQMTSKHSSFLLSDKLSYQIFGFHIFPRGKKKEKEKEKKINIFLLTFFP